MFLGAAPCRMGNDVGAFKDLTGKRFGRLTVVSVSRMPKPGRHVWLCTCDCGGSRAVAGVSLRSGKTASCGCLRAEQALVNSPMRAGLALTKKHGMSGTREHQCWQHVVRRGTGKTDAKLYADRGITVCAGWRASFEAFYQQMGARPSARHSIDRKDNDAGYWCGRCEECVALGRPFNCRWATPAEQRANQRARITFTLNGVTRSSVEWAERLGMTLPAFFGRVRKWPLDVALSRPRRKQINARNVSGRTVA